MPKAPRSVIPANFERNVFINCPFDDEYLPLFNAIVFTVHDMGFRPRCALEASNAGLIRLNKILDIISECKYSIHDLSRTELDTTNSLPRFNMPLELGLDLGCRRFGEDYQQEKVILVMDVDRYRYQKFISDIAGQDISEHRGGEKQIVDVVREWLRPEPDPRTVLVPSGDAIFRRYKLFQKSLPSICARLKWNPKHLGFVD
ncbi:MAG TPA: hypothetical protein VF538_04470 [Pyrinomonadaceae bacterium]|jgi:hypothetical protein